MFLVGIPGYRGDGPPASAEERFLMIELGGESYQAYCRRVPMLIPFILRR
jgi:hypothetical protein